MLGRSPPWSRSFGIKDLAVDFPRSLRNKGFVNGIITFTNQVGGHDLIDLLLSLAPFYIWRYNGAVEIVNFSQQAGLPQPVQVGARGECPHCAPTISYFRPVGSYQTQLQNGLLGIVSPAQCESCKGFVLVIGQKTQHQPDYTLVAVYPLGKPNDAVVPEVQQTAKGVAEDFAEALRCQWIKAYKACVVMCARSIQGSALALGATKKRLTDQIDELFSQGKITEALKDFAHEVRVTRNVGAHPDKDGLEDVTEQDASDIVEFTREYLHHVYVMPAKLKARKTPPAAGTPTP
jgi:hypothetical protein